MNRIESMEQHLLLARAARNKGDSQAESKHTAKLLELIVEEQREVAIEMDLIRRRDGALMAEIAALQKALFHLAVFFSCETAAGRVQS